MMWMRDSGAKVGSSASPETNALGFFGNRGYHRPFSDRLAQPNQATGAKHKL